MLLLGKPKEALKTSEKSDEEDELDNLLITESENGAAASITEQNVSMQ